MRKSCISIVLISIALIGCVAAKTGKDETSDSSIKDINAEEAYTLLNSDGGKEVVVIDIRTADEYNASHIPNAINIDFYSEDFRGRVLSLNTNESYLYYCRSGNRSIQAKGVFEELNATVYHMKTGFRDWVGKYPSE